MRYVVTGGAGFIGSHAVDIFLANGHTVVGVDKLTYAGNLESLGSARNHSRHIFKKMDICNRESLDHLFQEYRPNAIMHLAAESHVDRSITDPLAFVRTNVLGTMNLLNAFKNTCDNNYEDKLFYHISTDEVYGSLGESGLFTETTSYDPNSPYSASKASSDHFVRAYGETYGLPYIISNCSNNYGPNQFPEKLIPLFINNILNKKPLPVYGDGNYTRDWLYVLDHAIAIDLIYHKGKNKETYNIGGFNEWKNIDLVKLLCEQMDEKTNREKESSKKLITYVKDRPGHDLRYAIDASKIKKELGWKPTVTFEEGLSKTIDWYLSNEDWLMNVTSGDYQKYYLKQYS